MSVKPEVDWSYNIQSQSQTNTYTINVSIPRLNSQLLNQNSSIQELTMKISEEDSAVKFRIKIAVIGCEKDFAEIYYSSAVDLFAEAELKLDLGIGTFGIRSVVKDYQTVSANKWQYLTNVHRRDFESNTQECGYQASSSESLTLHLNLSVTTKEVSPSVAPASRLGRDLGALLKDGVLCDVTLVASDGSEQKAHSVVLAGHSPVLRALFSNDTCEAKTRRVDSSFDADTLRHVLTYMYTERMPEARGAYDKLLVAADYYQLEGLKASCEEAMVGEVTLHNCLDVLQLADLHSAEGLKRDVLEFIKDGHVESITKTESWGKISSVDIVKCIYEHVVAQPDNAVDKIATPESVCPDPND